jgi:hypothetical protein
MRRKEWWRGRAEHRWELKISRDIKQPPEYEKHSLVDEFDENVKQEAIAKDSKNSKVPTFEKNSGWSQLKIPHIPQ